MTEINQKTIFWKQFIKLCAEHNTKPNPVAKELELSSGSVTKWKNGTIPNDTTLKKIADYFGVPVSALTSDTPKPLSASTDTELNELTHDLTDEEIEELKRYAAYLVSRREKK